MAAKPIQIVDLFAGPGGLGEGFSSLENGEAFKIIVSAEMESSAHQTLRLRLRAFYRILKKQGANALKDYYDFCNGIRDLPFSEKTKAAWNESGIEAQQLTLGKSEDNATLHSLIDKKKISHSDPWVLIGAVNNKLLYLSL